MLRKLLGAIVALGLPAVLAGQAPRATNAAAHSTHSMLAVPPHALATQVQGEVVRADEMPGQNEQEGVDQDDDQNNHGDVDQDDGQNNHGDVDQDDDDAPSTMHHAVHEGDHENEQAKQGEHEHDDDDATPAPPATTKHLSRIGRHRP